MVMFGKRGSESLEGTVEDSGQKSQANAVAGRVVQKDAVPNQKKNLNQPTQNQMNQRSKPVSTVIGEDTIVEGKVVSKGTLQVDGTVKGEIIAENEVIIGQTGQIFASIKAKNVNISGKVHGNIVGTEKLTLQPSSEIKGDVQTAAGALVIESGAKLEGSCTMGSNASPAQEPKQKSNGQNGQNGQAKRPEAEVVNA